MLKNKSRFIGAALILIVAAIGVTLFAVSHAATPFLAIEPETVAATAPAAVVSDSTASGGNAVAFKATATPSGVSSTTPCVGAPAPAAWKHVVVLIFENKSYSELTADNASWIHSMQSKCGTYTNWKDADYKVTGKSDGEYNSKPNYATYTSGVPPSVHGIKDDDYGDTSKVDNIFNRINLAGKSAKVYQSGTAASCAKSNFSGAYHDPLRYYTNVGGQSSTASTYCNTHDVPIASFMTDVTAGKLPDYSIVLPTNDQNMHNNSISSGNAWAKQFLVPFLDSAQYKSGDTALFFLWDEDTPIPTVFFAPSIKPGSKPATPSGNPIGHYSALRTWQEMLGISPLLGDTGQAPSLLNYYNGAAQ